MEDLITDLLSQGYFTFVTGCSHSIQNSNLVWHIKSQIYKGGILDLTALNWPGKKKKGLEKNGNFSLV